MLQVFYNLARGRYALYTGEPVMVGFLRKRPGPGFWAGVLLLLNLSALIPALSTNGAAVLAALWLDRVPTEADRGLVIGLAYACLLLVTLPVLLGGKVYNMLQAVMTAKVFCVLTFCLVVGVLLVRGDYWRQICSGFVQFGNLPVSEVQPDGTLRESAVNPWSYRAEHGHWPVLALASIATLGSFAGYAGGGGLANSTYSNYIRDKGWGMGAHVGAIGSAIGGKRISLSHVGCVFPLTVENLRRWRGWFKQILVDQCVIWAPGCFMGMALPALLSLEFSPHSPLYGNPDELQWAQALITSDGLRHAPGLTAAWQQTLWVLCLLTGLLVLLPSQMSIVDDVSRRWTDILWTANSRVRTQLSGPQVKYVYYAILSAYVVWSFVCAWLFSTYGSPRLMVTVIANLNNVALAATALHLLWVNRTLLPKALRPGWLNQAGLVACAVFYLAFGVALIVAANS